MQNLGMKTWKGKPHGDRFKYEDNTNIFLEETGHKNVDWFNCVRFEVIMEAKIEMRQKLSLDEISGFCGGEYEY
jgi:hypothetical protein